MKAVADRIEAIAKTATGNREISQLRLELKESLHRVDKISQQSWKFFAVLAGVWIVLKLSNTTSKISALGLEIADIPLLLAVVPALAAFAFYRFACAESLLALIDAALQSIYERELPESYRENVTELLTITNVPHIESSLDNMESPGSFFRKLSSPWVMTIAAGFILIPLSVLGWMFVSSFGLNSVPFPIRAVSLAVTGLLSIRGLVVVIQCMCGVK